MSLSIPKALKIVVILLFPLLIQAQTKISKVRFELKEKNIEIKYDVSGNSLKDSIYIEVQGKKSGKIFPTTISGDLGTNITPGSNKKIIWNVVTDNLRVNEELMISVYLKKYPQPIISQKTTRLKPLRM